MTQELELTIKGQIEGLHLEDGDKIIVSLDRKLSREHVDALKEQTLALFPGHEVVVLAPGLRLSKETS